MGSFNFTGTVTHTNGNIIANIHVTVSQKMLLTTLPLKDTFTSKTGSYSFAIVTLPPVQINAAYIIEAKDAQGKVLASSGSLFPKTPDNVVNLTISDDAYKGDAQFVKMKTNLQTYADQLANKQITADNILFIATQTNLAPEEVSPWMYANQLQTETNISAQVFYGLFKQGLPLDTASLSALNSDDIKNALIKSAQQSFIPDAVAANADETIREWNNYIISKALTEKPEKIDGSLGDILGLAALNNDQQKTMLQQYLDYQGTIGDFWKNLAVTSGEKQVKNIQYALEFSALTGNQTVVTKALLDGSATNTTDNPLKQFAGWNESDWTAFINTLSTTAQKSVVPAFIEDSDESNRVKKYAGTIVKTLEKTFPTHSFFGKLAKSDDTKYAKSALLTFFDKNPLFDFKTVSPVSLTNYNDFDLTGITDKQSFLKELRGIKSMLVYASDFNVLNTWKKDEIDSAFAMAQIPKAKFIATYSGTLGSEEEALKVYSMAEISYMNSAMLWAKYHSSLNLPLTVIPSFFRSNVSPLTSGLSSAGDPTLRSMFGSLDACECEYCTSVFSAAAYFTDILHFLQSRSPDAYNELIRRRPDLVKINLDCANTNTILPYVDLVNELLEDFALTHKDPPETAPASYQTTLQADELAANPENLNYHAYDELKKAVFPSILPFNLPLEETRVYLKHLTVQRHELMSVFYAGNVIEAFDDYNICMERLGISTQEAKILSGETTGDSTGNSGVWNFYGFNSPTGFRPVTDPMDPDHPISLGNWLDVLSGRVDIFLQQTGLIYKEMLGMLFCDFINPVVSDLPKITIVSKVKDAAGNDVASDTCELDLLELHGMEESDLTKIHRFIRLWRKLGWSMYDLDKAAKAFSGIFGENIDENKGELKKISQANFLQGKLNMSLDDAVALWSDINSMNYTNFFTENYPPVISLYERMFRNKSVLNPIDPAFTEDTNGLVGNMDDHTATIFAAMQLSNTDYIYLKSDTSVTANNNLTLANLSSLYRHVLLAKKIGLSVRDFLSLKSLSLINPFGSPKDTFTFISKVDIVRTSGFSIDLINYLLRHNFLEETAVAPADNSISVFLSELRAALRTIETSPAEEQRNTLAQTISENLGITTSASHLLLHDYIRSTADAGKFIEDDFWSEDFSQSNFLKTYTDISNPLVPVNYEPTFVREISGDITQVALPVLFDNYIKLDKIATIIKKLKLSDTDLEDILKNSTKINCTDLVSLPVNVIPTANLDQFETLINLIRSRDLLPIGTPGIFDILSHAIETAAGASDDDKKAAKDLWLTGLSKRSNWDRPTLDVLTGNSDVLVEAGILKTNFPLDFCNGDLILKLKNCLNTASKAGVRPDLIQDIINEDIANNTISQAIKNAAKSKYDETQWLDVAKPLRDYLRERQRESLVAFVIAHSEYDPANHKYGRWKNSDELYEYFLIDVEMKPISITSRIKQAISSVQLFIDRVLMNLEHDINGAVLMLNAEQADEWKDWRKLFRVWEANRKIFLYPENWIEPELRDDKSPFFADVEAELLQNELNSENVEGAFYAYLEKLDEVARLEIVGVYHQIEDATPDEKAIDILHVFGRTYTNPNKYFHRTQENGEWTAWQRIETDIDGDHLIPVVFNRRLCLFWLFFTKQAVEIPNIPDPTAGVKSPPQFWKIQVAWSDFKKNKWSSKKISKNYIQSSSYLSDLDSNKYKKIIYLWATINDDGDLMLRIDNVLAYNPYAGPFSANVEFQVYFKDTHGNPLIIENDLLFSSEELPKNTEISDMQFSALENNDKAFYYSDYINITDEIVLKNSPNGIFKLVPIFSEFFVSQNGGLIFFQDFKNTFKVERSVINVTVFNPPQITFGDYEMAMANTWQGYTSSSNSASGVKTQALTNNTANDSSFNLFKNSIALSNKFRQKNSFNFKNFYHPHIKSFVKILNKLGVKGLLNRDIQTQLSPIDLLADYLPDISLVSTPHPDDQLDFGYDSAYSQYNWELFFHLPMLIACRLKDDQRFEEARKWFHYIFDPTNSQGEGKEKFWQFKPFYDEAGKTIETLEDLLQNETELEQQVGKWMANPFKPHIIARMRISAYMKNVVIKYLDNLVSWGDQLFSGDTIENINEATNLYILAAKILGERPQEIPPRAETADRCYDEITPDLDSFSIAMTGIENFIFRSGGPLAASEGNSNALGQMFYFCVPQNEYLLKYWDTVADRLFKIRHSLNIAGIERTLPLFEPPVDPGMLVRAAAAGIDLSSILSDISTALPNFRFNVMLSKANELCNDVKMLGNALLSALEKKDAEQLTLIRSGQELNLLEAVRDIKQKQKDEASENLESLNRSKASIEYRKEYYLSREFENNYEKQHLDSLDTALDNQNTQSNYELLASILYTIPETKVGAWSWGVAIGGAALGGGAKALGEHYGKKANGENTAGLMASTIGSYRRRQDDWTFQAQSADLESMQMEKQIVAADIRLAIAEKELENHDLQIENARETDDYMRSKFTNQQLYDWMIGQLSSVYFQSYQLAYSTAKKAEKCLHHELGMEDTSYIQFGYWDSLKKGLLSGEKLQYDLRRLENAYLDQNKRELEITKHISLALINPLALLQLKETGSSGDIKLPEELFDLDFPGHYFRRIKSVSISLPCIAGPYTSINGTLRLTGSEYRSTDVLTNGTEGYSKIENDSRFRTITIPFASIATSNAQNDSGVFELNFRDERYLPFEGAGVASTFNFELMTDASLRQFDYDTISDVILHLKYTARESTNINFKPAAIANLKTVIDDATSNGMPLSAMLDIRHGFPDEWHRFLTVAGEDGKHALSINVSPDQFPFFTNGKRVQLATAALYAKLKDPFDGVVNVATPSITASMALKKDESFSQQNIYSALLTLNVELGEGFTITVQPDDFDLFKIILEEMFLIVNYAFNL